MKTTNHSTASLVVCHALPKVQLGARWTPARVERRDSATGAFEIVNPMAGADAGYIDLTVQRALLQPVKDAATLARIAHASGAQRVACR
jgi:hypothetical protein